MASANGPFLQIAAICERVLEERDGVMSVIRMVDRFTIDAGPDDPPDMQPRILPLMVLIIFKAGAATGSAVVGIQPEGPDGIKRAKIELPVLFEGEDRGVALRLNIALEVPVAGLYWFDVTVDRELSTRIPVRVVYRQIRVGT